MQFIISAFSSFIWPFSYSRVDTNSFILYLLNTFQEILSISSKCIVISSFIAVFSVYNILKLLIKFQHIYSKNITFICWAKNIQLTDSNIFRFSIFIWELAVKYKFIHKHCCSLICVIIVVLFFGYSFIIVIFTFLFFLLEKLTYIFFGIWKCWLMRGNCSFPFIYFIS